ncbi:MAG: dihydropteroate synthase [Clostridiales bacterium]|nr:dihydropteroate synthase [Clostridiales bacterium]
MIWNCGRKQISLGARTRLMGILNITPDSFSDGGLYDEAETAVSHALEMVKDGADLIDIGAQSTRPGHIPVTDKQELARLEPVLRALRDQTDVPITVDTYYPSVAKQAIAWGADAINDVSGVINPDMARIIAQTGAGWIVMHTGGGTADDVPVIPDILSHIRYFFLYALETCEREYGIRRDRICLDPGIGFGKTGDQNLTIIRNLATIRIPDVPLLVAASRKRVVGQATGVKDPSRRIYGNIALHACAIQGGADILRVHEVRHERQGADMADALYRQEERHG